MCMCLLISIIALITKASDEFSLALLCIALHVGSSGRWGKAPEAGTGIPKDFIQSSCRHNRCCTVSDNVGKVFGKVIETKDLEE